jgi:hypothetical protein
MSAGSVRGVTIDGIPYNAATDANIALGPRIEKESLPHSGGNMIKRVFAPGSAEAVKLIVTPSEYDFLKSQSDDTGNKSLSYLMADGSSMKTQGEVMLGPYQTDDSSCEISLLSSSGEWDVFAAS